MNSDGAFDEIIASTYDADSAHILAPEIPEPTVDLLADLAEDRRTLEFAVGTAGGIRSDGQNRRAGA